MPLGYPGSAAANFGGLGAILVASREHEVSEVSVVLSVHQIYTSLFRTGERIFWGVGRIFCHFKVPEKGQTHL